MALGLVGDIAGAPAPNLLLSAGRGAPPAHLPPQHPHSPSDRPGHRIRLAIRTAPSEVHLRSCKRAPRCPRASLPRSSKHRLQTSSLGWSPIGSVVPSPNAVTQRGSMRMLVPRGPSQKGP
ncbi:hypothetical protein TraAM80_05825 [Trypanosoma rangeli]|uniref:Uncharacterized protein n=1 Tax=Trypanosoma rangeli TaxID=5698 RepID=A0A422NDH3_TRYRA|nr:uncharacterized protein TraAM80_05825 [Trypanosoma rangeli]RNF03379.1 hypothetical protein TraAM80_05825 [Trypanosoma rangeli]|eukprot:RNF03379.1 hypothetical protein TraAM80_05825 [Trypanosoma rangeli]